MKEKAKAFAINAHKGQVRKNEPEKPMIIHPIAVGKLLEKFGYDDNVVAAGYLHDVVEDTNYTLEDIEKEFGSDIKSLVSGASEPDKSLSWEMRKQHTIDETKNLPFRNKLVVCADKINNLEDFMIKFGKTGNRDFSLLKRGEDQQKWYYENIYKSLITNEDVSLPIFKRLKEVLDIVFDNKKDNLITDIFSDNIELLKKLESLHYKEQELIRMKELCDLSKEQYDEITKNYSKTSKELIDLLVIGYTDAFTSLKRDYIGFLALEKRNFLNLDNILEYNECMEEAIPVLKSSVKQVIKVDTTNISPIDFSIIIADEILTVMRKKYIHVLNEKYN